MMEKLLKTAGIMLAGVLAGAFLLSLAFLVPVNETNRSASYEIIEKEGWYPALPMVSASLDTYFHSLLPGVLDGSTDTIMLQTALEPDEENVLRAAMDMNQYDYYWHGYVAVLRPLLAIFDYGEIRVLNSMGQLLLVFLLCLSLWRRKGMPYALLILTSYFLLMPMAMPFSLQYSWVFYITAGCLLYLVRRTDERGDKGRNVTGMRLYWLFLIVGMLTSFFDLLTYPLYTWGVPVIWWLLLQKTDQEEPVDHDKNRPLYYITHVIFTGLWWILGYAGMWLGKFCLGSLILGRNIFRSAFYEVGFRLGMEENPFGFADRLDALYVNWKHYEYKLYVLLLAVWLIYIIASTLKKGVRGNVKSKALALAGISPVVWYFALANHTAGHHFFTYRIWGIAVLAVLAILLGAVGDGSGQNVRRPALFFVWGVCGIAACGLSLLAREEIAVTNGDRAYRSVELGEGEVCEMSFTPSFPTIKRIGICLETTAREGACIIRLEGEGTAYEEEILLSAYEAGTYADIPVDWKLAKGKEYKLMLSTENADGEVALLVTANQDMPLSEYGEAWVHYVQEHTEIAQDGQILSGLTYSYRPLSHFTLAFLAMTWTGILFAVCMICVREKIDENRKIRRLG